MTINFPKISVIIPVYNVEEYIHQCLDSIINQDYKNLEILLIDDGSPDKCPQICDEYAAKDNRIKVFHTQNNGLGPARNVGLNNATGEYVTFVDSDDWIDDGLYRDFVELDLPENDSDIFIYKLKNEKSSINWVTYDKKSFCKNILHAFICKDNARVGLMNSVCRLIIKKEIGANIRFYNIFMEDKPFFIETLLRSEKITLIPRAYYNYRMNTNSLSHRYKKNYTDDMILVMEKQNELFIKYGIYNDYPHIKKYHKLSIIRYYLSILHNESKLPETNPDNFIKIDMYYNEMHVKEILSLGLLLKLSLTNPVWWRVKLNQKTKIIEKQRNKYFNK